MYDESEPFLLAELVGKALKINAMPSMGLVCLPTLNP